MSSILELATKLRDTTEAIAHHEQAIRAQPSPALLASLHSLQKRMQRLEAEFATLAADAGVDVCRYRFFADYIRPTVNPVCSALIHFQSAFTLAFNAIKNGPRQVARITPDVQELTTFGIGYSFSGSLGLVLTFSNKQLGLFGSVKDEAMAAIFDLAQAESTTQVAKQAKILGAPTIRAVYKWASDHVKYGLGADIEWVQADAVKHRIVLESAALVKLVDALHNTSHTETETIVVEGVVGGGEHVKKHAFHFVGDDGADYTGRYTDAISEDNPVQWPKRYRAHIQKTIKVLYASDEEIKPTYMLLRLEPLP